ncbi:hypothetical protein [Phenylobacterium sp.]|uniref:hypothetical protein n=1 Tax=Phenylobacterium sp. TaxID=1871053 RepID=UPI002E31D78C|nr:hypothetical protein [Phenylobacterium sp.]HEX4712239.1 hypothetical protein [Phenylobacterium sp.]
MKLKTIGLALVATGFMASAALAQTGTMQPIPNPPEKAKPMHKAKKKSHMAKPATEAKTPAADAKAPASAPAPPKK